MSKTLILVDVQNDFAPGGALAVPHGDEIVAVINKLLPQFEHVIATKDWHPAGHASFASAHAKQPGEVIEINGIPQVMWPDHCIENTSGADFIPALNTDHIDHVVYKGTNPQIDSYSGFFDNQRSQATGLAEYLREHQLQDIYIVGLATDYCVKFTALDAVEQGFNTRVITDACRGVNMAPDDVDKALVEMRAAGCILMESNILLTA